MWALKEIENTTFEQVQEMKENKECSGNLIDG